MSSLKKRSLSQRLRRLFFKRKKTQSEGEARKTSCDLVHEEIGEWSSCGLLNERDVPGTSRNGVSLGRKSSKPGVNKKRRKISQYNSCRNQGGVQSKMEAAIVDIASLPLNLSPLELFYHTYVAPYDHRIAKPKMDSDEKLEVRQRERCKEISSSGDEITESINSLKPEEKLAVAKACIDLTEEDEALLGTAHAERQHEKSGILIGENMSSVANTNLTVGDPGLSTLGKSIILDNDTKEINDSHKNSEGLKSTSTGEMTSSSTEALGVSLSNQDDSSIFISPSQCFGGFRVDTRIDKATINISKTNNVVNSSGKYTQAVFIRKPDENCDVSQDGRETSTQPRIGLDAEDRRDLSQRMATFNICGENVYITMGSKKNKFKSRGNKTMHGRKSAPADGQNRKQPTGKKKKKFSKISERQSEKGSKPAKEKDSSEEDVCDSVAEANAEICNDNVSETKQQLASSSSEDSITKSVRSPKKLSKSIDESAHVEKNTPSCEASNPELPLELNDKIYTGINQCQSGNDVSSVHSTIANYGSSESKGDLTPDLVYEIDLNVDPVQEVVECSREGGPSGDSASLPEPYDGWVMVSLGSAAPTHYEATNANVDLAQDQSLTVAAPKEEPGIEEIHETSDNARVVTILETNSVTDANRDIARTHSSNNLCHQDQQQQYQWDLRQQDHNHKDVQLHGMEHYEELVDDTGMIDVFTLKQEYHKESRALKKVINKYSIRSRRVHRLQQMIDHVKKETSHVNQMLSKLNTQSDALHKEAADVRCSLSAVCEATVSNLTKGTEARSLEPACFRRFNNIRTPLDAANLLSNIRDRIKVLTELEVLVYHKQLVLHHILPSANQDRMPVPKRLVRPQQKSQKNEESVIKKGSIVIEVVTPSPESGVDTPSWSDEATHTESPLTISAPFSVSVDGETPPNYLADTSDL